MYRNIAEESAYGFGADLSATYFYSDDLVLACRLRDSSRLSSFIKMVHTRLSIQAWIWRLIILILPKLDKQLNLFLNTELNFENIDAG